MIVVDTNVIAGFWIRGSQSSQCERVHATDRDWHSPYLWKSEFRNVVAGYLRRSLLTMDGALELLREAEAMMHDREHVVASSSVLSLIGMCTCSAYDLEFVALAKSLGVILVTGDQKVVKEFPNVARSLASY